jgi:hypothetical protein
MELEGGQHSDSSARVFTIALATPVTMQGGWGVGGGGGGGDGAQCEWSMVPQRVLRPVPCIAGRVRNVQSAVPLPSAAFFAYSVCECPLDRQVAFYFLFSVAFYFLFQVAFYFLF